MLSKKPAEERQSYYQILIQLPVWSGVCRGHFASLCLMQWGIFLTILTIRVHSAELFIITLTRHNR